MHKRCLPLIGLPVLALFLSGAGPIGETSVPNLAALKAIPTTQSKYVFRQGYAKAGDGGAASYIPSTLGCTKNSGNGDNGSEVKPNTGVGCWLASWPNAEVNVLAFGADPTGVADSAPAINAMLALKSNHKFIFPTGTYLIASTFTSPYPLSTGAIGFGLFCTAIAPCENIEIDGRNSIITVANANNNIDYTSWAYINHFDFHHLQLQGNPTALPINSEPTGFLLFNMTDGIFHDIKFPGNWGGSTRNPVAFAADNLTDVVFDRIWMPQQSECFDTAFLRRVSFENIIAIGADDTASGGPSRMGCINVEYDGSTIANYPALVPYTTSDHITIEQSVNTSNFGNGLTILAGGPWKVGGSFYNNPGGTAYGLGAGVLIFQQDAACCQTKGDPIHDVSIFGAHLDGNGTVNAAAGLYIDATRQALTEVISNVQVNGTSFNNNTNTGVKLTGTHYTAGSFVLGASNLFMGANQTTNVNTTFAQAQQSFTWTPADASGAALAFTAVSAKYTLLNNIVVASVSLNYPATGSGAAAQIGGLPFTSSNFNAALDPTLCLGPGLTTPIGGRVTSNSNAFALYNPNTMANYTNANLSGASLQCRFVYRIGS